MAGPNNRLPEGTDTIIEGAGVGANSDADFDAVILDDEDDDQATPAARATASVQAIRGQAAEATAGLRGQATDRAREFAIQGKDRATEALDNLSQLFADAAAQVDEKVGAEYGDYARRAQDYVDDLAQSLRDKDVDTLFADGRELVRRSPGIAAGAAAVIGFALVRIIKAGLDGDGAATTGSVGASDRT